MQIIFLHSAQVESSRNILPNVPASVQIIDKHAEGVGVCPNFSAYPSVAVIEDDGTMRVKSGVTTWEECQEFIDTPDTPAPVDVREYDHLDFLGLFTDEELVTFKSFEQTDPVVALFWEQFRNAKFLSVDDNRVIKGLNYLTTIGVLTEVRKVEILRPAGV